MRNKQIHLNVHGILSFGFFKGENENGIKIGLRYSKFFVLSYNRMCSIISRIITELTEIKGEAYKLEMGRNGIIF